MIFFDIPKEKIKFNIITEDVVVLSSDQKTEVEELWTKKLSENPTMFRGINFGLYGFELCNDNINVFVNKVEYPMLVWGRSSALPIRGTFTLGTYLYVHDDKNIYLATRGNVALNKGKISTAAGGIDYSDNISEENFLTYLQYIACKEGNEEYVMTTSIDQKNLEFLGMCYSIEERKLIIGFKTIATAVGCANDENKEFLKVSLSELRQFEKQNRSKLTYCNKPFLDKIAAEYAQT